jgi:hypothetical protein
VEFAITADESSNAKGLTLEPGWKELVLMEGKGMATRVTPFEASLFGNVVARTISFHLQW